MCVDQSTTQPTSRRLHTHRRHPPPAGWSPVTGSEAPASIKIKKPRHVAVTGHKKTPRPFKGGEVGEGGKREGGAHVQQRAGAALERERHRRRLQRVGVLRQVHRRLPQQRRLARSLHRRHCPGQDRWRNHRRRLITN